MKNISQMSIEVEIEKKEVEILPESTSLDIMEDLKLLLELILF